LGIVYLFAQISFYTYSGTYVKTELGGYNVMGVYKKVIIAYASFYQYCGVGIKMKSPNIFIENVMLCLTNISTPTLSSFQCQLQ